MYKGADLSKDLAVFFNNIEPLVDKTLLLLFQLPSYLTENKYFDSLQNMVNKLDNRFRYALEVRDSSWFNDKVYDFLKNNKIALTWSVRDELKTPPVITSDQIYIRFIGDRSIDDKDFGKIVKDRKKEMVEYVDILSKKDFKDYQNMAIAFNNHFAGFGPQSANTFLKLMDKPEIDGWTKEVEQNEKNQGFFIGNKYQTSISDFTSFKT
jgi:uncharacterized protein YecE (DUF72 family)